MFSGSSSPPKDKAIQVPIPQARSEFVSATDTVAATISSSAPAAREKKLSPPSGSGFFGRRASDDHAPAISAEKKRRSSTVTKAASFFTSAKNSLSLGSNHHSSAQANSNYSRDAYGSGGSPGRETVLQRLSRMDPALAVPQGPLNNSAGESLPTARSSFRVGVTEDKNRKCRRTMEDTHSYLYNFLGTPSAFAAASASPTGAADSALDSDDAVGLVETDNGYFAIFDGHAGTFAAEWCGKKLHLILEDVMRKNPNTPVPELLDHTFTSVDQQLEALPLKNSGCTAVIAVLRWENRTPNTPPALSSSAAQEESTAKESQADADADTKADAEADAGTQSQTQADPEQDPEDAGKTPVSKTASSSSTVAASVGHRSHEQGSRQRVLYTANVGDARIVLCRSGKALRLSYDHKGSDENEGKRIASAGGLILNNRVNGVLAVTRALGDAYLKDLVTGHPYTTETVIQPEVDEFLILACDGLWDVCSDQEAVDLIREIPDAQTASKVLVDHALARFSTDNLSCMVIRFDPERIKETAARQSTETLGADADAVVAFKGAISETDKIVESARKSMANAGLADTHEKAGEAQGQMLERMALSKEDRENEAVDVEMASTEHNAVDDTGK